MNTPYMLTRHQGCISCIGPENLRNYTIEIDALHGFCQRLGIFGTATGEAVPCDQGANAEIEDLTLRMQRQVPEQGHLAAAAWYKKELVARFGLEAAFEIARANLSVPGLDRIVQREVVPLQEVASSAVEYRQIWAGGRRRTHHRMNESGH